LGLDGLSSIGISTSTFTAKEVYEGVKPYFEGETTTSGNCPIILNFVCLTSPVHSRHDRNFVAAEKIQMENTNVTTTHLGKVTVQDA